MTGMDSTCEKVEIPAGGEQSEIRAACALVRRFLNMITLRSAVHKVPTYLKDFKLFKKDGFLHLEGWVTDKATECDPLVVEGVRRTIADLETKGM